MSLDYDKPPTLYEITVRQVLLSSSYEIIQWLQEVFGYIGEGCPSQNYHLSTLYGRTLVITVDMEKHQMCFTFSCGIF